MTIMKKTVTDVDKEGKTLVLSHIGVKLLILNLQSKNIDLLAPDYELDNP